MTGPAYSGRNDPSTDTGAAATAESHSALSTQHSALDKPLSLPMPLFLEFLRRLHDGPPQHAAAVKVALAVWQGAVTRGDAAGAQAALQMVRDEMNRLIESIVALQAHGRRLAGEEPG